MIRDSFTLIETLVVATIIALLISGSVVSYSYLNRQSRDGKRKADIEQIRSALEMYRSVNNIYPTRAPGNCTNLLPVLTPYIHQIPVDPKSTQYSYYCTITTNDYTICAYLENGSGSCSNCGTNGCGASCNYSVGPFGQKCPP